MVFGLTALASSWEAFRWAIEALTKVFANRPDLVIRHKKFIDMLKWEEIDPSAKLTPAFSCTINHGIMDDAGKQRDLPARIYFNDALMPALDADQIIMVLEATIEAIFIVMGEPDVKVGQCLLAMDKWLELVSVQNKPCWHSLSTPTDSQLPSLQNTFKRFSSYSTLLGTPIDVVLKCQKPKSSLEN
jgi:hypothetical protein